MIVAIIKQGSGVKDVEEFREAASEAAAVTAFCGEYSPPKTEGDYVGVDTGWGSYQAPAAGKRWSYDHDTPALVQTDVVLWEEAHVEEEYDKGRLVKRTWYASTDGAGTFSDKVSETVFTHAGKRLISETVTDYDRSVNPGTPRVLKYYEGANPKTLKKELT